MAVTEFSGSITKTEAKVLTDRLVNILINSEKYKLVERSMMDEILKEQGFQQTGCTDQSCAVEIGQLLGVEKICTGTIGKVGSLYSITLRVVSVSTAEIEVTASYDFKGSIEDVLHFGITEATNVLLHKLQLLEKDGNGDGSKKKLTISPEQKYQKKIKIKKGFAFASTALAVGSAGSALVFKLYENSMREKYLSENDPKLMDKYFYAQEDSRTAAIISLASVGTFATSATILWFVKIKKPVAKRVSITPVILPGYRAVNFACRF